MNFLDKYYRILVNSIKENRFYIKTSLFFKKKDVIVFFVFLMISTSIWFFNALRNEYTYEYSFSIKLINVPDELLLISPQVQKLNVKVEGVGYSLIRQVISNRMSPISYDVSKLHSSAKTQKSYLLSSDHYDKILSQLLVGVDLLKISPDTLFVQIEPKIKKQFPVKLNGELHLQKQYIQSDKIMFEPESVWVAGRQTVIDTMNFVYTTYQKFVDVNDTVKKNITLEKYKSLEFSKEKVAITIPVEAFTEKSLTIPIELLDINDSLRIKFFPPDIKVTFRTALSKIDKINHKDFEASIDEQIFMNDEMPKRLKVRLKYDSPDIKRLNFSPIYVDYLIERK